MPKKQKVDISFEVPKEIKPQTVEKHLPVMASHLVLAVEIVKLRFIQEGRKYSEQDVYEVVFNNFGAFLTILQKTFQGK